MSDPDPNGPDELNPFRDPINPYRASGEVVSEQPELPPPSHPLDVPWGWSDVFIAFGLTMLAVVMGIVAVATLFAAPGEAPSIWFFIGVGAIFYGSLLASTYYRATVKGGTWRDLGFRIPGNGWIRAILPLFAFQIIAASIVNVFIMQLLGDFENPQAETFEQFDISGFRFVGLYLLIAVLAPIAEEVYFRGMMFPLMRRRFSMIFTIFQNALLFAVVHFIPLLVPSLFVIGCVLTWARDQSDSIYPSIALHVLQNSLAVVILSGVIGS